MVVARIYLHFENEKKKTNDGKWCGSSPIAEMAHGNDAVRLCFTLGWSIVPRHAISLDWGSVYKYWNTGEYGRVQCNTSPSRHMIVDEEVESRWQVNRLHVVARAPNNSFGVHGTTWATTTFASFHVDIAYPWIMLAPPLADTKKNENGGGGDSPCLILIEDEELKPGLATSSPLWCLPLHLKEPVWYRYTSICTPSTRSHCTNKDGIGEWANQKACKQEKWCG